MKSSIMCKAIALAIGAWLAASGTARAQTAAEKAAADTLFNEGKKLIAAGDTAGACTLFEASLAKATQLGTQLALAACYEKLGRTASAWGEFRAAAATAGKARDKRQRYAEDHAAGLESRLSKIAIKLEPGYRVDGLVVKRDGEELTAGEFGAAVPVDPGDHLVEAVAPGWQAWSNKVTISAPGAIEVVVPALGKAPVKLDEPPKPEPAHVAPAAEALQPLPSDPGKSRRSLAIGVGAAGVGLFGVSLIFGAVASSRWGDAKTHCTDTLCDAEGVDLAHGAQTMGNVSTGVFVVGAAAIATAAVLYFTAPRRERAPDATALRIAPSVGAAQVGLALQGGF